MAGRIGGSLALTLLIALFPGAFAIRWVERAAFQASSFAGATTSAVFPVPNATNAASQFDSFFPEASAVGFAGPTPTGDEAELVATATSVPKVTNADPLINPSTSDNKTSFNVLRSFGNLSPMFSVDSLGLRNASMLIPEGCELTQVHLLHRHGARYPTSGSLPAAFATKLHNATVSGTGFTASGDLAFLNTWQYKLGAEILTPFGRQQLFDLGVSFRVKYGELLKDFTGLPVFRTTSEERMVQSALNFAAGFFGIPDYLTNYRQLITIESDGFNNSLAVNNCDNQGKPGITDLGTTMANKWRDVYLQDALSRLAPQVQGLNLTTNDMLSMQEACAYETVALGTSEFCELFTEDEWKGFNYYLDLDFWYGNGPGNPTTAAFGIGYVQELVARLTQTPIAVFNTSTNATIADSNITFPLDQPIFVDASHDTDISSIVVAMNFTSMAANGPLPIDHIPDNQTYFSNQIVPFASQLVGQVLTCPASSYSSTKQIRWLLNDAVVPLTGITGCPEDATGLCPLDAFISAMQTRLAEVDFAFDCFGNYTVPVPDTIVDGRPPANQRPQS
ncbi:phosphoglycerate mutase-like protein [Fomitiporia mediterranea MF3/22]|uniref:phosphoglycerate mutase-like protein n=1 Tax=Fomitiporia mediterranea (strain MF3/22) TaxID=694068 RepID=UPI0004409579|nr:phosphoglycerate mutase-like protein [Fomitiporia mediterranea MF3/22]EJD00233.1 phosphoglycerate mutase-like protein [Fomitiporia mediterranea MF3/22]